MLMDTLNNARAVTVKLLGRTFSKGGYSNIVLDQALKETMLSPQDRAFCTALYYGVLERKITLDHIIMEYSKKRLDKINPNVVNILRVGVYQLKYMDGVPDNAAVNESVEIAKKMKLAKLAGFVNAVMRNFIRDEKKIFYPENPNMKLSVEYSVPRLMVEMLLKSYTYEETVSLLKGSVGKPPVTIRLNSLKGSQSEIMEKIRLLNPKRTEIDWCVEISTGDVQYTDEFMEGLFHVQDIASQLCCMAVDPKPGEVVLDMCAAPGGKSFTMAELAGDKAEIYAFDLHENRVHLIDNGCERLGLRSIKANMGNAWSFNEEMPAADKILCDVPCSGLGVIRRKPEIKYKNFEEFDRLPDVQYKILENASKYLKVGGELVYSTCTVNVKENGEVVDKFLEAHPDFQGVSFLENMGEPFGKPCVTLFPQHFNNDGFFIAKIKRIR